MDIAMEHRLGRTVRVFLAILAAAGLYRLTVVPLVEPRSRAPGAGVEMSAEQERAIRAADASRFAAFSDLFPPGAWELSAPLHFEMGRQMQLLCKDYDILPDGRVRLEQCTILVLPERRSAAGERDPGRTYVLRAPQGAILEFDAPPDLKRITSLPRLIGGSLRGQVTIRGTATAPGREDDVEIVTRDIELSELEVRSNAAVQFRYGRSRGEGRGLVAVLRPRQAAAAHPAHPGQGPNIGGVDSIRIDRDVRMRLEGFTGGFVPGADAAGGGQHDAAAARPADATPVLVTCRGALCLNEPAKVITLEENVDIVRDLPDRNRDHITCDLLTIYLARTAGQGRLEPVQVIASGKPVVARSTAEGLEACAATLGYDLKHARIVLSGNDPVAVKFRGNEVVARGIEYREGAAGAIGMLDAAGPGWAKLSGETGSGPVTLAWEKSLLVRPDPKYPKEHVASLIGDARVTMEGQGSLRGAKMHLWLATAGSAAPAPRPTAGPDLSGVRPNRLRVRGSVEAESVAARVTVRTEDLQLWFARPEAAAETVSQPARAEPPAATPPAPRSVAGPSPSPAPPAPPRPAAPPPPANRRPVVATAASIRGQILLAAEGARLDRVEFLELNGEVRLVEQPPVVGGRQPAAADDGLRIEGDQLALLKPQQFNTHVIVRGKPARVAGRGGELQGPHIEANRGLNRMKVDGAGRLTGPVPEGAAGLDGFALGGPAAAGGGRIHVTWSGRMEFDGSVAQFHEAAVAETGGTRVSADVLEAVLDRPFSFDDQPAGAAAPQLMRFAGNGAVRIENESRDGNSRSVQRLHLRDFIFQRQSGDFIGHGPGRLSIVRSGATPTLAAPGGLALPGPPAPVRPVAAAGAAAGLSYLGVDFQRDVRGNMNRQMLEFHQRVEAIHGPVAAWNDTLDPRAPRGPGKDEVLIKASQLSVAQGPRQPGQERGQIDVQAGGNVEVEAETFSGVSSRLTWSEAKDLIVFEGNGLADARVFRQGKNGGPEQALAGEKILYWRGLNTVEMGGIRHLDYQLPAAPNGRSALPRGPPSRMPVPLPVAPPVPPGT